MTCQHLHLPTGIFLARQVWMKFHLFVQQVHELAELAHTLDALPEQHAGVSAAARFPATLWSQAKTSLYLPFASYEKHLCLAGAGMLCLITLRIAGPSLQLQQPVLCLLWQHTIKPGLAAPTGASTDWCVRCMDSCINVNTCCICECMQLPLWSLAFGMA